MAVELATAYVSLVPSAKGVKQNIARELDIDQPAERAGRSAGGRLSGALGKAVKGAAVGVGVAAGAALSGALVKGWGRLTAIEEAQSKLAGLGHSAQSVATIMDNALASVRGTAFGLDEAATVAASAVAAGIKPGENLQRVLSLVADTSSIAGSSMGEMGAIFNKVAASNRLTMGEVNQLADRGVPILQMLADQFGVTAAEMSKMVSRGEVDFPAFAQAVEANIAGAALESGNTTRGAFANMGAAASRFGASLLEGLFPVAKEVFGGVTTLIDCATEAVKPRAEAFSGWVLDTVVPAARELAGSVGEIATRTQELIQGAKFQEIKADTLERLGSLFETLAEAGARLGPAVATIAGSLAKAAGSVGVSTWQLLLTTVEVLARVANAVLVPAVEALAGWMERNQGTVTALVGAYATYRVAVIGTTVATAALTAAQKVQAAGGLVSFLKKVLVQTRLVSTATKIWSGIQAAFNLVMAMNPITLIVIAIAALVAGIVIAYKKSETFRDIVDGALRAVGAAATWLWENAIQPAWKGIKKAFEVVAGVVSRWKDAVVAAAKWVWDKIKDYFGRWKGTLDSIRDWVAGVVQWVRDKFTEVVDFVKGLPGKIASAARGMWDGIKDAFRSAINWVIDKWNGLSFTLPGFEFAGQKVGGFTLAPPRIPRLAEGGIVPATPGGRIVQVAEAGEAEAIIPLSRLRGLVGEGGGRSGPEVLELVVDLGEGIRERLRIDLRDRDRRMRRRALTGAGALS